MDKEGVWFVVPLLAAALVCGLLFWRGSWGWCFPAGTAGILAVFCAYFFRNPVRLAPPDPCELVSPADGRVLGVRKIMDPDVGRAWQVDIFLSIFNVHLQRSPFTTAARVLQTSYHPGKFMAAFAPKASLENEQNWIVLESAGRKVVVKQIAGLIARRVLCRVCPGQVLEPIQNLGLIRFGSQVDVIVPASAEIAVKPGDIVAGGESLLASFSRRTGK